MGCKIWYAHLFLWSEEHNPHNTADAPRVQNRVALHETTDVTSGPDSQASESLVSESAVVHSDDVADMEITDRPLVIQ